MNDIQVADEINTDDYAHSGNHGHMDSRKYGDDSYENNTAISIL